MDWSQLRAYEISVGDSRDHWFTEGTKDPVEVVVLVAVMELVDRLVEGRLRVEVTNGDSKLYPRLDIRPNSDEDDEDEGWDVDEVVTDLMVGGDDVVRWEMTRVLSRLLSSRVSGDAEWPEVLAIRVAWSRVELTRPPSPPFPSARDVSLLLMPLMLVLEKLADAKVVGGGEVVTGLSKGDWLFNENESTVDAIEGLVELAMPLPLPLASINCVTLTLDELTDLPVLKVITADSLWSSESASVAVALDFTAAVVNRILIGSWSETSLPLMSEAVDGEALDGKWMLRTGGLWRIFHKITYVAMEATNIAIIIEVITNMMPIKMRLSVRSRLRREAIAAWVWMPARISIIRTSFDAAPVAAFSLAATG